MSVERGHDHLIVRLARPRGGAHHPVQRLVESELGGWMLMIGLLSVGTGGLLTCMGASIPILELVLGPGRESNLLTLGLYALAIGFSMLAPLVFLLFARPDNTMVVRVGASWLQVDDESRVSFDQLGSFTHVDGQLTVLANGLTMQFRDPDEALHRVLTSAIERWQTTRPHPDEADAARQEQARLRRMTGTVKSD